MSSAPDLIHWHGLLEVALPGTQRQSVTTPPLPGALGALLGDIAASSQPPARQLLQMAGAMAICSRAGFQPAPVAAPAWQPALPEASTLPDQRLIDLALRPLLQDGPQRLQNLALTRLAVCGLHLPPVLLPMALELGRRNTAVRPALTGTLGARGRWLAAHNSSWAYAAGVGSQASMQEQWELGTPEQRRASFAQMRQTDANVARGTLAAELKTLSAAERTALLPLLARHLSASDEALLDGLLTKDRSSDVRQAAANLLARLPHSRHGVAITTALAPLVKMEHGIFGKKCTVEAPLTADPAWQNEAIDATRPQHEALGERAWWLYQLVRHCPLDWWQQHTGLGPEELLKATAKSEWHKALLRGWREATVATQHPVWAEALLQKNVSNATEESALLAVLPLAQREQYWAENIPSGKQSLGIFLQYVLQACPLDYLLSPQLSGRLAKAIASELRSEAASSAYGMDYTLRHVLPDMLCVLDIPELELITTVPTLDENTPSRSEGNLRLVRIATARRMLAALPMQTRAA